MAHQKAEKANRQFQKVRQGKNRNQKQIRTHPRIHNSESSEHAEHEETTSEQIRKRNTLRLVFSDIKRVVVENELQPPLGKKTEFIGILWNYYSLPYEG